MDQQKNIILISIDDGGAYSRYREAFGEKLQLPNLDRIEAASTVFTSAYCQAPICGPSRNSLMSGLSPHQTGILDNYTHLFDVLRPEQLWQYRLKQRGFYCSTAGKVHHSYAPLPRPVHDILYSHPPRALAFGPPMNVPFEKFGGLTGGVATTDPEHDPLYYDHQSAADAVAFLNGYDRPDPFYREIGFHHPHISLKSPLKFYEQYDESGFEQPEDWLDGFETADYPDLFMVQNMDLRDKAHWRKSVRNYFAAYSHVDHYIGQIWDALKESKHAQNTIVVIVSDHGYHLGDKGRMRKFTLWEESCRVPLIIHDPEATPARIDDPVALLDVGPTILDYADCPPLNGAPGTSLRGQINGAREPDRAIPTFLYGNSSMRKGRYRITLYQNGESEFHDVEDDPWMTRNLAFKHPDYDRYRQDLSAVCSAHGLALHEGGASDEAAGFTACNGRENRRHAAGTRGMIGAINGAEPDFTPVAPGARQIFATMDESGAAPLPADCARLHYGADSQGKASVFTVFGNHHDNEFKFPGGGERFILSIHPGPGKNRVINAKDDLVVYCGEGEDDIYANGARCVYYGGTGRAIMRAGNTFAQMFGGSGDTVMMGGAGPNEMHSGGGSNKITAGSGPARIKVNGGQNQITLKSAETTLTLERTGLPQTVVGFQGGEIDLSDWNGMAGLSLTQHGSDTILSSASERVVFIETQADQVRAALKGVRIA